MKQMLSKKFKREKEMDTNAKNKLEEKQYLEEKKAEKVARNMESKRNQDAKLDQKKQAELRKSKARMAAVNARREENLLSRSMNRNTQIFHDSGSRDEGSPDNKHDNSMS